MGLRVATNIASINAQRNLGTSQMAIQDSMAKLSSGSRINKAADDAAGLAISENMKAGIRSIHQATRNANDGVSLVQTAEGGLNEIGNIITRMRELGIQASSDTVGKDERGFINKEIVQLKDEMKRIASTTSWGKTKLLDGSAQNFDFQVGTHNDQFEDRITFKAGESSAKPEALGLADIDYTEKEGAQSALEKLDMAQTQVNAMRSSLGALQNRLVSTISNQGVQEENLSAANSRIRDTDVASATAEMTKNNILLQASTATLAQANSKDQLALKLIG
jgi:flagellin